MSATGTRAVAVLRRAGVDHALHPYETPDRHGAQREARPVYGRDAALALGVDPATVCKTLVVIADGVPMLAILSVDRTLDLKRLAAVVGAHRAVLADAPDAERVTGYLIGGISPFGTKRRMRTLLDVSAGEGELIHVSAGRRGLQVSLRPADLVTVAGAELSVITSGVSSPHASAGYHPHDDET